MIEIKFSKRQEDIIEIVKNDGPITGREIADRLSLTRATLRPDLAILTMAGNLDAKPRVGYFINPQAAIIQDPSRLSGQLVRDYKAHPIVLPKSSSVYDAIVHIFLEDVGTLYAVDEMGMLAGIVSRKDLLRAAIGNRALEDLPISVIMTRMPNIITVKQEETLYDAATKLIRNHIDSLPVVVESDASEQCYEVVGRITKTTITKAYTELFE